MITSVQDARVETVTRHEPAGCRADAPVTMSRNTNVAAKLRRPLSRQRWPTDRWPRVRYDPCDVNPVQS
jgi:hypothetical protein